MTRFKGPEREPYQCMGCAYENMYSPRDEYGFCDVCRMNISRVTMEIAARMAEHKVTARIAGVVQHA